MGIIQFYFFCVVRCIKQGRGQKTCFNGINRNTKLIQHRLKSLLFPSWVETAILEKNKVVSDEPLKQTLSLRNH